MVLPKEDRYYGTKADMTEQIIHLLGGRVAEKLKLDDISTGASNDISRATEIARDMVTKYGFSEKLGPVNYSSSEEVFLGKDFSTRKNYSEEVAAEIDEEIKAMVESAFEKCEEILKEHDQQLETVAKALLEVETLDGEQFTLLFEGKLTPEGLVEELKKKGDTIAEKNRQEAEEMQELQRREEEELAKYDGDYLNDDPDAPADGTRRPGQDMIPPLARTYEDIEKEKTEETGRSGDHDDEDAAGHDTDVDEGKEEKGEK